MKTVLSRHSEQYSEMLRELGVFREAMHEQRQAQGTFENTMEASLVAQVEQSVTKLEDRIHNETERLWKLFDEHKARLTDTLAS